MKPLILLLITFVLLLHPLNSEILAQEKVTLQDIERWTKELSNWNRWGKEDQLGALNLITPAKRVAAAKLVQTGISVSMAHELDTEVAIDNKKPAVHKMLNYGENSEQWASDEVTLAPHGIAHTHMDSLCHYFHFGRMYNGIPKTEVTSSGAMSYSIDNLRNGIFTRGLLIDMCWLKGVKYLEPKTAITPKDIEVWEKKTGIKISSGDVVFFRVGRWEYREEHGPFSPLEKGLPGLHVSCAPWLHQRDVAMVGSDAALDVIPSGLPNYSHPVHLMMLHVMGVHIFDNCDLRAVSKQAQELNRWEFLITAAPLRIKGGTGSALNPIATF